MKRILVFLFAVLAGTNLMAATLHVDLNSTNPTAPYASRDTAAKEIQTAVNAAIDGDTVQVWDEKGDSVHICTFRLILWSWT